MQKQSYFYKMLHDFLSRIAKAFSVVFTDRLFVLLAASLGLNLLAFTYLIFFQTTTFAVFFLSNSAFYNWTSIGLDILIAVLFGIALAMAVFLFRKNRAEAGGATGSSFFGAVFGAVASGCPVCGAWILPLLGIAGSLAVFPFQGLEIKVLAVLLLLFSISQSARSLAGICDTARKKVLVPLIVVIAFIMLVYALPQLPQKYKFNFSANNTASSLAPAQAVDGTSLVSSVIPEEGYTINAIYGDIGPKILQAGGIDLEKFTGIYERAGTPLSDEQMAILTKGLDKKITITQDNSYFLLNFFWALGLVNKNTILEDGQIAKYGKVKINSFASTGGWTIGAKPVMDIYSSARITVLNDAQQQRVEEVAGNVYRPCCGNSTAFPDCNHGMALLGVLEVMAAQDASADEMYDAAKYFNAFWFPQQYLDIAAYFKAEEGKDFADIDAKVVVSNKYSSAQGWSKVKRWLENEGLVEKAPASGGGCGV